MVPGVGVGDLVGGGGVGQALVVRGQAGVVTRGGGLVAEEGEGRGVGRGGRVGGGEQGRGPVVPPRGAEGVAVGRRVVQKRAQRLAQVHVAGLRTWREEGSGEGERVSGREAGRRVRDSSRCLAMRAVDLPSSHHLDLLNLEQMQQRIMRLSGLCAYPQDSVDVVLEERPAVLGAGAVLLPVQGLAGEVVSPRGTEGGAEEGRQRTRQRALELRHEREHVAVPPTHGQLVACHGHGVKGWRLDDGGKETAPLQAHIWTEIHDHPYLPSPRWMTKR